MTIDMKSYAGEIEPPAAVEQQLLENVQTAQPSEEFPMPSVPELAIPEANTSEAPAISQGTEDPQALNFRALSESVERIKAEREAEKREHQLQLDLLRANMQRPQEAPKPPKQMFDGMADSDLPNVGELRRAWAEREAAYNERIEELQVISKHPDYAEIINKYGKHLAENDPVFLQGIRGAENKALFAYQYAKKEQRIQQLEEQMKSNSKPAVSQPSATAQKIVDNARKPGTLSQAGGQGALSKADYYATMSDQEFMKFANQHLEGI